MSTMSKIKKSDYLQVRIDPELKNKVEGIFDQLGLTSSQAIILFYNQVKLQKGLPFDIKLSLENSVSDEEMWMIRESQKDIETGNYVRVDSSNEKLLDKIFGKNESDEI
jgi:addiction module RelB/DinJ family antitoxin